MSCSIHDTVHDITPDVRCAGLDTCRDCAGCMEPLFSAAALSAFDPGHDDYCTRANLPCHALYCTERCFDNANERRAESEYEDFHSGAGPLPLDEQCRRAAELK